MSYSISKTLRPTITTVIPIWLTVYCTISPLVFLWQYTFQVPTQKWAIWDLLWFIKYARTPSLRCYGSKYFWGVTSPSRISQSLPFFYLSSRKTYAKKAEQLLLAAIKTSDPWSQVQWVLWLDNCVEVLVRGFNKLKKKKSSEFLSSCFGCLQTLFLHDIPQFAKIGLSDDIIRFKLKSKEVVFFSLFQFTIQMENGSKIH